MHVFITGATGLIGRRLVLNRLERGDRVVILSRDRARAMRLFAADVNPSVQVIEGDPVREASWQQAIDGCDTIVHLAGAGVADHRWTEDYKRVLHESRVVSTHNVVEAVARATRRPRVLVCASAIGYYGDTGDREADESTSAPSPGDDFLADLCRDWEAAAERAREYGVRVVHLRTGVVLDPRGGSFIELVRPFRFFAGGTLGRGGRYMSWIHYRDVQGLIDLAIARDDLDGPINLTSPTPTTARDVAKSLGRAVNRPAWLPVPGAALHLLLGEFAKHVLMSQRVIPRVAIECGYHFLFPEVDEAMRSLVDEMQRSRRANLPFSNGAVERGFDSDGGVNLSHAAPDENAPTETAQQRMRLQRPPKRVRLLAIDVDGTLLRTDGRLAQGVIDACRAAERAGCVIVPATARPPRSLQPILQTLGTTGPTINYNGAVIWNPVDRAPQYHEALDAQTAKQIIEQARAMLPDILVSVELLDRWFTDRFDPSLHTETSRVFEPD